MAKEKKKDYRSKEFKANNGRFARLSKEERTEIARKGGKARQEKYKKQKTMQEMAKQMLACDIDDKMKAEIASKVIGLPEEEMNVASMIIFGQILAALKGNPKSFELLLNIDNQQKAEENEADGLSKALEEAGEALWQDQ